MARKKKVQRHGPIPGAKPVIDGERVRALREKAGKTQLQLAYECACIPAQISGIETGKSDPRLALFRNLVLALDTTADHLLGLDGK